MENLISILLLALSPLANAATVPADMSSAARSAQLHFENKTISVPNEVLQKNFVTVSTDGTAGFFFICSNLKTDKNGALIPRQLAPESTGISPIIKLNMDVCRKHEMNTHVAASVGWNMIVTPTNSELVWLNQGESKEIKIRNLSVPRIDGSYTFHIFVDFSARFEQIKQDQYTWLVYDPTMWYGPLKFSLRRQCKAGEGLDKRYAAVCAAWRGGAPLRLSGSLFSYQQDGSTRTFAPVFTIPDVLAAEPTLLYETKDSGFGESEFTEVAAGHDGDTVRLMPGNYGIKFCNSVGTCRSQLGIVIDGSMGVMSTPVPATLD